MAAAASIKLKPLQQMRDTLLASFVGREAEVGAVLAGLVSGEPTLLVGEPGTAKTALVEALARLVGGQYFYYLLSRFTEPDELLGPIDVVALRQGQLKRITAGRLPEAHIVFLDEIFKASTAIRNVLLDVILNRRFLNGAGYQRIPMLALYTASNEVSHDEEDAAFYDRLTIRQFVKPIEETLWVELLEKGAELTFGAAPLPSAPLADVAYVQALQDEARRRALLIARDGELRGTALNVIAALRRKGLSLSDRRKIKYLLVVAACSLVASEPAPTPASFIEAAYLVAPRDEDDETKVTEALKEVFGDMADIASKLLALEAEVRNAIQRYNATKKTDEYKALKQVYSAVAQELKRIPPRARFARHYRALRETLSEAKRIIDDVERGEVE
ncbi:MAG: AAA family ATPase [Thermofilum sp.]|nr:AAA family ATPase [Thermofilum sp.]